MRGMVAYKGKMYLAEQDKRGRSEEADVVVYKGAEELFRRSMPKMDTTDDLRMAVVKMLARREKV